MGLKIGNFRINKNNIDEQEESSTKLYDSSIILLSLKTRTVIGNSTDLILGKLRTCGESFEDGIVEIFKKWKIKF